MQGSSRTALASARQVLGGTLSGLSDPKATARDLFAVVDLVDRNATLRRALADSAREPETKSGLVQRLLGGKIGNDAMSVLIAAVGERWSAERDLSDALEQLAVEAMTASAEKGEHADAFENEMFRFERLVASDTGLSEALADRSRTSADKRGLVNRLLVGKVSNETLLLAARAAGNPRGRRFDRTMEEFARAIANRRGQSQAIVTSAVELTPEQSERLRTALSKMYGKPVQTNVVIDPEVVGGIKVQVGDDVIDGTIARRLDEARAHLSG